MFPCLCQCIYLFHEYGVKVTTFDPWAKPTEVKHEYDIISTNDIPTQTFAAIVLGVAHAAFLTLDLNKLLNKNAIIYVVKAVLGEKVDRRL